MKPKPKINIDYPLFVDMDVSYMSYSQREIMYRNIREVFTGNYAGIDPKGRVWLRFTDPTERKLSRDILMLTLTTKLGYKCIEDFETITGFSRLQNN